MREACLSPFGWLYHMSSGRASNTQGLELRLHGAICNGGYMRHCWFVAMRQARDATLAAPELLMPSIQVNMRAGKLPPADENGVRYLKIPVRLSA